MDIPPSLPLGDRESTTTKPRTHLRPSLLDPYVDPTFAAAAAQLGRNVLFLAEFGFAPPRQTYERARQALQVAIKLDPSSGLAHGWLGWVHMAYDWNWEAADAK